MSEPTELDQFDRTAKITGERERLHDFVTTDIDTGFEDEHAIGPLVIEEIGDTQKSPYAPNLKNAKVVELMFDHIRFEMWRRRQLRHRASPPIAYTYQPFALGRQLYEGKAVAMSPANQRQYVNAVLEALQYYLSLPVRAVWTGATLVPTTWNTVLERSWPLTNEDALNGEGLSDAEIAAYVPAVAAFADRVTDWLANVPADPDTTLNLVGLNDPAAVAEPEPTAPLPDEPTVTSVSTTSGVNSELHEEVVRLRQKESNLRAALEQQATQDARTIASLEERLRKMADAETVFRDQVAGQKADIDALKRKHATDLTTQENRHKKENELVKKQIIDAAPESQQAAVLRSLQRDNEKLTSRLAKLHGIQVVLVRMDENNKARETAAGTLGEFEQSDILPEHVFDAPNIDRLIQSYNARRGETMLAGYADHVEQDKLARLADQQLGVERVLATFSDTAGKTYATMELPRLAPKQTEDLRRFLIADLRNESQVVKQGLGRKGEIPREGQLHLQVYDRGGLVKETQFDYAIGDGRLHAQAVSRGDNDARLYATGLTYATARPDMIVIPY